MALCNVAKCVINPFKGQVFVDRESRSSGSRHYFTITVCYVTFSSIYSSLKKKKIALPTDGTEIIIIITIIIIIIIIIIQYL